MNDLVNTINNIQNGDSLTVSVPLIDGNPLVINGHAEVDASGNVTIRADKTQISGIPIVDTINVSNIVLTIERGNGIEEGGIINATISAKASKGFLSASIDNANLSVDLTNNTLTVSNAPSISYGFGSINLNDTYDISGGEGAFSVCNESAVGRDSTNKPKGHKLDYDSAIASLETMMGNTAFESSKSISGNNGFTGFNPVQAQNDIDTFVNQSAAVGANMCHAYMELLGQLKNNWCSKNAKLFGNLVSSVASSYLSDYKSYVEKVYNASVNAYNKVAEANGVPLKAEGPNETLNKLGDSMGYFSSMSLKEANDQGAVGMNIDKVNEIKENFISASREGERLFGCISSGIALYDKDNAQQNAFKTTINNFASNFIELSDKIVGAIDEQIAEEALKIQQAANAAAETISS